MSARKLLTRISHEVPAASLIRRGAECRGYKARGPKTA
jgi:hypothetical protein